MLPIRFICDALGGQFDDEFGFFVDFLLPSIEFCGEKYIQQEIQHPRHGLFLFHSLFVKRKNHNASVQGILVNSFCRMFAFMLAFTVILYNYPFCEQNEAFILSYRTRAKIGSCKKDPSDGTLVACKIVHA